MCIETITRRNANSDYGCGCGLGVGERACCCCSLARREIVSSTVPRTGNVLDSGYTFMGSGMIVVLITLRIGDRRRHVPDIHVTKRAIILGVYVRRK